MASISYLTIILLSAVISIQLADAQSVPCMNHDNCSNCLSSHPDCSWCTDKNYSKLKPRCMVKSFLIEAQCESIEESVDHPIEIIEDKQPRDYSRDSFDGIHIRPQRLALTLRKGQTKQIRMSYRPARNFPLDLYYLMDLTWSMRDDKQTLVGIGNDLANTLYNLTQNYRLGFGSFADKPIMPYILEDERNRKNPCALENEVCEPTYGFIHRQSMTEDIRQFIAKINASSITGNLDNLEGGLDALMQVIVCNREIGWSTISRKIVVLATDGNMHLAGDGLLAGITKKNDKQCHLSDDGTYTASLVQDYPSLEEIYRQLSKNKINVIFAVTQDVVANYDQIHQLMQDISSVGVLTMDSSNILKLVNDGYWEFIKRIQFLDNSPPYIKMTYKTKCGNKYNDYVELDRCSNVEMDKDYEFLVDVKLLDYPQDGKDRVSVHIEEASLPYETLNIIVNLEDECPCLARDFVEVQRDICTDHGDFKCGMCLCDSGWDGRFCDCDLSDYRSSLDLEPRCRPQWLDHLNQTYDGPICTDRGECSCGQCECYSKFTGRFCECEHCPFINNLECGGSDRATCDCGKCNCNPGWIGENCDCHDTNLTCIAPRSSKICSNRGFCECGECKCAEEFHGRFCEINYSGSEACATYEKCVECAIKRRLGETCEDFENLCSDEDSQNYDLQFVSSLPKEEIVCVIRRTIIIGTDEQSCEDKFSYKVDDDMQSFLAIIVQEKCGPGVGMAMYSAIIIFATLILGLIVLCLVWAFIRVKDAREYAQFEEQRKLLTVSNDNPIYKSPHTTYVNPIGPNGIKLNPVRPLSEESTM